MFSRGIQTSFPYVCETSAENNFYSIFTNHLYSYSVLLLVFALHSKSAPSDMSDNVRAPRVGTLPPTCFLQFHVSTKDFTSLIVDNTIYPKMDLHLHVIIHALPTTEKDRTLWFQTPDNKQHTRPPFASLINRFLTLPFENFATLSHQRMNISTSNRSLMISGS